MAIVGLVVLLMILSPWLVRYDPVTANAIDILLPPSANHWFGTDNLGMDIFSRVIYAPRVDLVIALASAVLAVAIGVPVGVISGFYRGLAAEAIGDEPRTEIHHRTKTLARAAARPMPS